MTKAAVFYDLENCLGPGLGLGEIHLKIREAMPDLTLSIQRAYANFAKGYTHHVDDLHRYGIQPMQVFGAKPNAVDFEMSLDALRLVMENSFLKTAVIVSNDGDFLPLLRHLRELQLEVISVLTKSDHHSMLASNATYAFDFSLPKPAPAPKPAAAPAKPLVVAATQPANKLVMPGFRKISPVSGVDVFNQALLTFLEQLEKNKAFKALSLQQGLLISVLGAEIKKANPDFSPEAYGSKSLILLLEKTLVREKWGLYCDSARQGPVYICLKGRKPAGYFRYQPKSVVLDDPVGGQALEATTLAVSSALKPAASELEPADEAPVTLGQDRTDPILPAGSQDSDPSLTM